ncbi:hypothetical protein EHQ64_09190 [Leptospira sarikeiensis]|uniref:Uncharacterized protein n=2 Tax=Leptospira sarikeiensis TaxID=2484943 RepID=A0A4R9K6V7_9LEPT|nr:hypothetical protein EHQ64_09190 [Leptospira sarikeiensis]
MNLEAKEFENYKVYLKNASAIKVEVTQEYDKSALIYFKDNYLLQKQTGTCFQYTAQEDGVLLSGVLCGKKIVFLGAKSVTRNSIKSVDWGYVKEFIITDFLYIENEIRVGGFVYLLEDGRRVDWSSLNGNRCIESKNYQIDPSKRFYTEDEGGMGLVFCEVPEGIISKWYHFLERKSR